MQFLKIKFLKNGEKNPQKLKLSPFNVLETFCNLMDSFDIINSFSTSQCKNVEHWVREMCSSFDFVI